MWFSWLCMHIIWHKISVTPFTLWGMAYFRYVCSFLACWLLVHLGLNWCVSMHSPSGLETPLVSYSVILTHCTCIHVCVNAGQFTFFICSFCSESHYAVIHCHPVMASNGRKNYVQGEFSFLSFLFPHHQMKWQHFMDFRYLSGFYQSS